MTIEAYEVLMQLIDTNVTLKTTTDIDTKIEMTDRRFKLDKRLRTLLISPE